MNRIKELRIKENLSQAKLAELVNLTQQAVGKWESGKSDPDNETLKKLSDIFDVTIDYIIYNTDSPVRPNIELNEIEYALFGETKHLNESEQQELLRLAKFFRGQKKDK